MEAIATKDSILEKAKLLKPVERLQLVDALLESLDKPDKEIEKQWIKEADARYDAYKRGEAKATDWEVIKKRYE
jgi:putative addiction module component (TIGR02574 family)